MIEPKLDFVELAQTYAGEWIAVDPNTRQVVAHGPRAAEVAKKARAAGIQEPLVTKVLSDYGGLVPWED